MAVENSSQKFVGETRAPRVQIEYDVDVHGETKNVELPFVTGVLSSLSGHSQGDLPPLSERSFMEVDQNNINQRVAEIAPTLELQVDNHITGEGSMAINLAFENIEQFRPDELARQVPALAKLLQAREQLSSLVAYMDGKVGAEDLVGRVINNQDLLGRLQELTGGEAEQGGVTDILSEAEDITNSEPKT